MKKKILPVGLILGIFVAIVPKLAAFDEFVIEKKNKFGGSTTEYSDTNNGISRGIIYYNKNKVKVKERIEYDNELIKLYKIEKTTIFYSSGVMVTKDSVFNPVYTDESLIKRIVMHYDKHSGKLVSTEKYFSTDYLGYNITHYKAGILTKVEWFYPSNVEGIEQHNVYFNSGGDVKMVEYIYTPKTVNKSGCYRSIYFLAGGKKVKQTWFFNKDYELQHNGIVQRTEYYHHTPLKKTLIRAASFDRKGNPVEMKSHF